jgi:hypothetical protein
LPILIGSSASGNFASWTKHLTNCDSPNPLECSRLGDKGMRGHRSYFRATGKAALPNSVGCEKHKPPTDAKSSFERSVIMLHSTARLAIG